MDSPPDGPTGSRPSPPAGVAVAGPVPITDTDPAPPRALRRARLVGAAAAAFAVALLVPDLQIAALTGAALLVVFSTVSEGRRTGLVLAGAAVALAGLVGVVDPRLEQPDAAAISVFAVALVMLVLIVDRVLAERRRAEVFLGRLQAAVNALSDLPGLSDILESIAASACESVDAKFVSVLARDEDGVFQAALHGDIGTDTPARSEEIIERIMADPGRSPSGLALTSGECVVVRDIASDPRFSHWVDETRRQHFTSTVAVPLQTGSRVIGVLAAYFRHPAEVGSGTVELLSAYASQVTVVVLRALAYEHEKRAADRLAEADRLKSDLVATVSHELRTPLTSVKGFLETVLRHWERFDDVERRELLQRSLHNADLLADLIDQVLDYSRLEAQAVQVDVRPRRLVDEVMRALDRTSSLTGGHRLEVDVPGDLWCAVDPDAFERILVNLISNACRYSEDGTLVTVSGWREGEDVVVAVGDQGCGIAEEERERIFERFYRVGVGVQSRRGTGVGLAIVKRYLELLGGRIRVESEVGEGSTFAVSMPTAAPPSPEPDTPESAAPEWEPDSGPPAEEHAARGSAGAPVSSATPPTAGR